MAILFFLFTSDSLCNACFVKKLNGSKSIEFSRDGYADMWEKSGALSINGIELSAAVPVLT